MNETATDHIDRWLGALARYFEAQLSKRAGGWELDGATESWERFLDSLLSREERQALNGRKLTSMGLSSEPDAVEQWRDRLRLVEKSAARTLTDAPVAFAAVIPSTAAKGTRYTVVRFAFGFSLSLGHRIRRRYTVYSPTREGNALFRRGDDRLFAHGATVGPLDLSRKELREAMPALSTAAKAAEEKYRQEAEVVAEITRLRHSFVEELGCLQRLYIANWGQDAPVLGAPPEGLKGDDVVEAEYVTRLEDLVDRYHSRVQFEPLTIGVIEGWDYEQFLEKVSGT